MARNTGNGKPVVAIDSVFTPKEAAAATKVGIHDAIVIFLTRYNSSLYY
jgi:hypothetical protein